MTVTVLSETAEPPGLMRFASETDLHADFAEAQKELRRITLFHGMRMSDNAITQITVSRSADCTMIESIYGGITTARSDIDDGNI